MLNQPNSAARRRAMFALTICLAAFSAFTAYGQDAAFALRDGERVLFYGDSITEQRLYTTYVEHYVVSRFPARRVAFINTGWGGDSVTRNACEPCAGVGGLARLKRDVLDHRPTVVTLLFGMNDGNYQVFDPATFKVYTDGLADIIHGIKRALPQTRIYVMTPTVYDGTRHTPWSKNDAYNDVLDRYSEAAKQLAANEKLPVIDLHAVTTETLRAAKQQEPAYTFLPDGVHPEADGQLVMAAEILRVWGASPTGATVTIEAAKSTLAKLSIAAPMPWSVPLPSARLQSVRPEIKLLGGVNLRARGLAAGRYRVTVDGAAQEFTAAQLDAGVSLSDQSATARQASEKLAKMARERADLFFFRWRQVETKLDNANYQTLSDALARFDALLDEMTARERRAAQAFSYQVSIESLP